MAYFFSLCSERRAATRVAKLVDETSLRLLLGKSERLGFEASRRSLEL